jgi:hypothetical protein
VAGVAAFDLGAGAPGRFFGFDLDEGTGHVGTPTHAVEDEEFGFRAEVGGIAQAGGLQVGFSALGDGARIAVVALAVGRLDHVTLHEESGLFHERVDVGGVGVRDQQHVGGFDTLPAGDRRTVEGVTGFELIDVEMRNRHGNVLFLATGVSETEVDKLDFVVLHHLQNLCGRPCHANLLKRGSSINWGVEPFSATGSLHLIQRSCAELSRG